MRTARLIPLSALALALITPAYLDATAAPVEQMKPAAETLLQLDRPLVIAHRGFSSIAPENTLAAFQKALIVGADLTELDYHHSQDGHQVVIHDSTLDRTTDAKARWGGKDLKVVSYPFSKLRELDAGGWSKTPVPGEHLPELGEALDVIQQGSVTLIERKAGDAAACVALIREKKLLNQVVVQSFDWNYLRDYHALEPRQILAALGPQSSKNGKKVSDDEKALSADWCDEAKALGASVVAWNKDVDRRAVNAAHRRGLKVWVYTIDDEKTANELLDAGVDGIISNKPALMWKVLAGRGAAKK